MNEQLKLTLKIIKQRSSAKVFERGQSYHNSQRIYNTTQRGSEVQVYCMETMLFL